MRTILYLLLLLILFSCNSANRKETIRIFRYEILPEDTGFLVNYINYKNFLDTYPNSLNVEHINIFYQFPEKGFVALRSTMDSVVVYNKIKNTHVSFALSDSVRLPVKSIYFQDFDSVFIFFDPMLLNYLKDKRKFPDFILVDSAGHLLNSYYYPESLKEKLYHGQEEGFIFPSSEAITDCRIKGDNIYLSFAIYLKDAINNPKIRKYNTGNIYEFNLKTKEGEMLPIKLPDEDIGKGYLEEIGSRSNGVKFILYGNSIIFGYFHSPSIYKYSLKDKTIKELYSSDDFIQNLYGDDTLNVNYYYQFDDIIYNKKMDVFIRNISIKFPYNFRKSFKIKEIFDADFNPLGYFFQDSIGYLVIKNGSFYIYTKSRNSLPIKITDTVDASVDSLMKIYIPKKEPEKEILRSDLGFKERLELYYSNLGIPDSSSVLQINSDILCVHCIEYLAEKIKKNPDNNIYFVFVGSDMDDVRNLIYKYEIKSGEKIIIDIGWSYGNYFTIEEQMNNYIIRDKKGEISIIGFDHFAESVNRIFREDKEGDGSYR
jgi:hypothetical protein